MCGQYGFRIVMGLSGGLLVLGMGCSADEVDVPAQDGASDEADDGSSGEAEDGVILGLDDGGSSGESETETETETDDGGNDEAEVDPLVYGPAPGGWPAAAFDGTQYLVVWEDYRAGRPILYGGRIAANGTALDPFGFPILDALAKLPSYKEYEPAVVFDGANFLVVTEMRGQILGVRVSPAGKVLDPEGILIAVANSGYASRPSLIFDGQQYLVAWGGPDNCVYRARVKPDGIVLDPDGALAYAEASSPAVSFDGTHTLLSWVRYDVETHRWVVYAGRIAVDGTLIDETPIRISLIDMYIDGDLGPVAGFDGTNHLIAWSGAGIWASRVTPEATLLEPDAILVDPDEVEDAQYRDRLDLAASSGRSLVVWSDRYSEGSFYGPEPLRLAEIADDGTVSVPPANAFITSGLDAALTVHPDGGLLLWRAGKYIHADYPEIVGTRLSETGTPVGDIVTPASPASRQAVQAVASDGENFFVVWTDTRDLEGEGTALYGARFGADGTLLDPECLQITNTISSNALVVFDGANFVVTWVSWTNEWPDRYAVRVNPAGKRLDDEPRQPSLDIPQAAASDGTHTLLVGRPNSAEIDLEAVLMSQTLVKASDAVTLATDDDNGGLQPGVSFDGIGYLAVWHDYQQVFGQRISKAGQLEGPRFSIAGIQSIDRLTVGAGGGLHLVVWSDASGIWAKRVSPDGEILDPESLLVVAALDQLTHPSVAFNGENFVVAWNAATIPDDASSSDLFAVNVTTQGEVLGQFAIVEQPDREGPPVLAGGNGRVLAAYDQFLPGPPYDTRRVRTRVLLP
jgi:hypothetical protein